MGRYMGRNYSVDVLKLVFAIFIAMGHFGAELLSSTLIVDCFFVLSGYFIVRSFDSGKYKEGGSFAYVLARVKRIYPYYIVAFIILFIVKYFIQWNGISALKDAIKHSLPEIFLIQNIGVSNGGINYPLWQMSTLIVASYLLFGMLVLNRNLVIRVVCPILTILIYTYLSNIYGSHTVVIWGVQYSFFYVPLLRAIGGLTLGMAVYELVNCIVTKSERWKHGHILVTILSVVMLMFYKWNHDGYQALIAFIGIMICCLSSKGIIAWLFNRKCFKMAEKLSLSVYLNHAMVISLIGIPNLTAGSRHKIIAVYILIIVVYSFVFVKGIDICKRFVQKRLAMQMAEK